MNIESTPVALREPAHQVCPRAVNYWRATAFVEWLIAVVVAGAVLFIWNERPGWVMVTVVSAGIVWLLSVAVVPTIRFRVHRWEVDDVAVHTRAGWLGIETRIAPLNRVQTVDSHQGPVMRLFRIASLTVTTASAAGPITIVGLDAEEAKEIAARLTAVTSAIEGDAT